MKLLKKIEDGKVPVNKKWLKVREAARAILFDEDNRVPLMFLSKKNYHKLPGGGVDEGESIKEALVRECLEEVGGEIDVQGEIGKISEYRSKWLLKQTSYCYHGKLVSKGESNFTEKEIESGSKIIWVEFEDAITRIENDRPEDYQGKFIRERELAFLHEFKRMKQL
ncbi:MAG: NUDIX domain-containing protein [Nanoarchaeota archaeon]